MSPVCLCTRDHRFTVVSTLYQCAFTVLCNHQPMRPMRPHSALPDAQFRFPTISDPFATFCDILRLCDVLTKPPNFTNMDSRALDSFKFHFLSISLFYSPSRMLATFCDVLRPVATTLITSRCVRFSSHCLCLSSTTCRFTNRLLSCHIIHGLLSFFRLFSVLRL